MTPLSSIFSFNTLCLKPWIPWSVLTALALFAGAELVVRRAVASHRLHVDASARQLIEDHRKAVAHNTASVWLLGNSTLGYGVDEKLLARGTRSVLLKLPHGSATVMASAKLLEYYLGAANHPPKQVVVFLTKDDLNLHGYRAVVSSEYETLCQNPPRKPQEFLMLWRTRSHIAARFESMLSKLEHHGRVVKAPAEKDSHFNGTIAPDDEMYIRLLQNYEMDSHAIQAVADAAQ